MSAGSPTLTPIVPRAHSGAVQERRIAPLAIQQRDVPVFLYDQDLMEDAAFLAPLDWCRRKRAAGHGKFVHHSRAFKLVKPPTPTPMPQDPPPIVRGISSMVGEGVMNAYCEGEGWAIEILWSWRRDVAKRLRRYRRQDRSATRAEGAALTFNGNF
jgi:hypothetical protein